MNQNVYSYRTVKPSKMGLLNNIELKEYESVITHEMDLEIAILTHLKNVIVLATATA
jgi:hypothetical protein